MCMKGLVLVLASVVVLVFAGCAGQAETSGTSETTTYTESAVLKVSVLESGVILVDGAPATIEALDEALTGLERGQRTLSGTTERMGKPSRQRL